MGVGLRNREYTHSADTGPLLNIMISLKHFRQVIDKLIKSPVAGDARVQIILPNGEFYDVKGIQLMENKLLGVRETHRIAITIEPESWRMGKVIKKL